MLIYTDKDAVEVAQVFSEGTGLENRVVLNPEEIDGDCIICVSKRPLGGEFKKLENILNGKKVQIIGVGFTFAKMKGAVEALEKKGVSVGKTLCVKRKGFLQFIGKPEENELARVRAFGERIGAAITGEKPRQVNEKNRIKNYRKPINLLSR